MYRRHEEHHITSRRSTTACPRTGLTALAGEQAEQARKQLVLGALRRWLPVLIRKLLPRLRLLSGMLAVSQHARFVPSRLPVFLRAVAVRSLARLPGLLSTRALSLMSAARQAVRGNASLVPVSLAVIVARATVAVGFLTGLRVRLRPVARNMRGRARLLPLLPPAIAIAVAVAVTPLTPLPVVLPRALLWLVASLLIVADCRCVG